MIKRHVDSEHPEEAEKVEFEMILTGTYRKAYERQIEESIRINKHRTDTILNSKSEFHGPSIRRRVVEGMNEECNICGKKFTTKFRLFKHKEFLHNEMKFPCDQCEEMFSSNVNVNIHRQNVHGVSGVQCDESQHTFRSMENENIHRTKVHRDSVSNKTRFTCDECPQVFSSKENLDIHKRCAHYCSSEGRNESLSNKECGVCGQTFKSKVRLYKHEEMIHGKTRFSCNDCYVVLDSVDSLKAHVILVHEGPERQSDISRHINCSMTETCKPLVNIHTQSVHVEPNLTCDKCHQSFNSRENLSIHTQHHCSLRSGGVVETDRQVQNVHVSGTGAQGPEEHDETLDHDLTSDQKLDTSVD